MKKFNREVGKKGEEIAAKYLQGKGYKIHERNYSTKFGEIDLIVSKNNILSFVEVKLKKGEDFGTPEEMIGKNKRAQVERMANLYLTAKPGISEEYNSFLIDAVCIVLDEDNSIRRISYYENIGF